MENSIVNTKKDTQQREDKDTELVQNGNLSKRLTKVNGERVMILSIKNPQTCESCIQESLLQSIYGLDTKIPIQISSFDEMYLRRCLELVHFSAFPEASSNLSTVCTFDLASFGIECPLVSADGDSILGTITRSQSMVNILKSPLFRKFGAVDIDANFGTTGLIDGGESTCSDFTSSPGGLCVGSSQKLQREMVVLEDHKYGSQPVHKRVFSVTSTNSTCSDQSSSSTSGSVSHGILQCTWFEGTPHFLFSLDDQSEIYVASLLKAESIDDIDVDFMYTFHSRTGHEKESNLVGKMKVSTSFTLCPNNTHMMETQFVLYGFSDTFVRETQTPIHNFGKNKGLSKKVGSVFRAGHLSRQRTSSKFAGTSAILENSSWEPNQDCGANFQENDLLPDFELAAIIVKDHIHEAHEEPRIGGWGLNFLKKVESTKISENEVLSCYESCQRNVGDCSTSMDIIIPAGFHGGPRLRNGGPTSLIKRWSSGGRCDCGGWDLGCPLRVLKSKSNEGLTEVDVPKQSKTIDIFVEGSKQGAPIMKMNGHDRLYYIDFQLPLSALQSFSIAAAIIHSRSPTLRSKVYRS